MFRRLNNVLGVSDCCGWNALAGEGEPSWMVHCEKNTLQHFDSHHAPPEAQ
jgi:hypothetical protein